MTRKALNLLSLCLSVAFFAVPITAFTTARYLRFATGYFSNTKADPASYALWIVIVLPIWALVVSWSKLNRPETIITFDTGIRAIGKAVFWMMTTVLSLFFF